MTGVMEELTPLAVATTQLHEMFEALQEAGFTPDQALYLVGQALTANAASS